MRNATVPTTSAGFAGRPFSRREIPWYASAIGNAEGSIIATIITTIKAKNKAMFVEPIVDGAISIIVRSEEAQVTYQATATTATTTPAMGIVRRRSRSGTAGETASPMARGIGRPDKNSPSLSNLGPGTHEARMKIH